jgi:predicted nucleotidyltransferase
MAEVLLRDLDELRRRIAPHVARARTVIAFGSVARGDADAGRDLDLIVVADRRGRSSSATRTSPASGTCGRGSTS